MNVSTLILLTVFGTALAGPVSLTACPSECEPTERHSEQPFMHVSELRNSSIAPWTISPTMKEGREPYFIPQAVCKDCKVENWVAKPIVLQIQVFQQIRNGTGYSWCKCPFNLAVGCTCVSK